MTKLKFFNVSTGFIAVFIGYASAAAIIFQAAMSAGATEEQSRVSCGFGRWELAWAPLRYCSRSITKTCGYSLVDPRAALLASLLEGANNESGGCGVLF
ncbi:benzoate/H(+) symporter BenE family transporter [Vibrio lentus]|nr:benzoate/H(+) symporter BenE family transporter [Vibrio lentus]